MTALREMLTNLEFLVVIDTLKEEITRCERIDIADGDEPVRADLLRSALHKMAPEVSV
jgi:hypothetical protein